MATESEFKSWTINAIKDAVRATGSHWLDPDTMRFFKTRVRNSAEMRRTIPGAGARSLTANRLQNDFCVSIPPDKNSAE